jgi:hypothetical protein
VGIGVPRTAGHLPIPYQDQLDAEHDDRMESFSEKCGGYATTQLTFDLQPTKSAASPEADAVH